LTDLDNTCADAALLGVTVCVAAGDNGYTDSANAKVKTANVDFPASSPHVLACGGTKLVGSGTTITSETVWNELASGEGATGGGISAVFPVPAFQQSITLPKSLGTHHHAGRGVPDVAGNADPSTGFTVLVDGKKIVVGGTSAVAPTWAALIALLNQGLGTPAGFLTPKLYQLGANAINDITVGNNGPKNGGYQATAGWDACTGLGTPQGTALLGALQPAKQAMSAKAGSSRNS
jgi:kumamolisin